MHAEGRRFVEHVQLRREEAERAEIEDVRLAWAMLTDRERAIVLATFYDDVEIPPEPAPETPRRWWRR